MHELGAAKELFQVVEKEAKKNGLKEISKVKVKLGEASGIKSDFLRHSFVDHIFPGSIAEGAELEIIEEKVNIVCRDCGARIDVTKDDPSKCPDCGSSRLEVTGGKDLCVDSIEGE
jgi:hydrogenase nickel incorporation protein HypA/HybF